MAQERTGAANGLQGLTAFAGLMLGVIPLAGWLIAGRHSGPFRLIFGEQQGALGYVVPLLVILGAVVVIAALEAWKKRA
ncbi:hypothetical protein [Prauserella flavalba]|uniref:Uncharacterized protein n=1 Tax=Prauserella flavalba TaxID=1477506 RepID=A0A318LF84_9PSEU|nr:hypothetical protein [Prauserella flavalba]PXY20590.1 hypothetical protein BA062_32775 [Prauserella flavalba]